MPRIDFSRHKAVSLTLVGVLAVALVLLVVFVRDGSLDAGSAAGTMKSATIDVNEANVGWHDVSLDGRSGQLLDDLSASVTLTSRRTSAAAEFQFFLSRDQKFDADDDCLVQTRSVRLDAGSQVVIPFQTAAYIANCVDAGPWFAAIRSVEDNEWIPLDDRIEVAGGRAELALARVQREVGEEEPITVDFDVYREMSVSGLAGLWQHPADVWLRREGQLCVIEAERLTLPREATRGTDGSWKPTRLQIQVEPGEAMKVTQTMGLKEAVLAGRGGVSVDGRCPFGEGEWEIAVGPGGGQQFKSAKVYAHAAPVEVDAKPIKLTLVQGESTTVERQASNPSRRSVSWSIEAGDFMADDWLLGTTGEPIAGGSEPALTFSISAAELQPGFYRSEFKFRAEDYYHTEISIPVELTVRPGQDVADGAGQNPDATFELGNYPNPFNSRTTIRLQLKDAGNVRLAVYDVSGREVRLLVDEWMDSGSHEVVFDADDLPSGTYLYRVATDSGTLSRSMTLVN